MLLIVCNASHFFVWLLKFTAALQTQKKTVFGAKGANKINAAEKIEIDKSKTIT